MRDADYLLILRLFALTTAYFGLIHAQLSLGCASLAFKTSTLLLFLTIDLLNEYLKVLSHVILHRVVKGGRLSFK
jgi:hypothetical protein